MNASRTTMKRAEPLDGRWVRLTFGDGAVHEVDLADLMHAGAGFAEIRNDSEVFRALTVNREFGTLEWPGGIDLDPDVLRGDQAPASGAPLPRRVIQPA